MAYLFSLSVQFLVDVFTDGFSAFDKIQRSVDLLIAGSKLGFSFRWDGQGSSTVGLLLLVGVTLCLPHGPGTTRVTFLPSSCQLSSVAQPEQLGLPWHGSITDKTRELICVEPHLGCWVFLVYIEIQCIYLLWLWRILLCHI